ENAAGTRCVSSIGSGGWKARKNFLKLRSARNDRKEPFHVVRTTISRNFVFLRNFEAAQCFLVAQVGNLLCRRLAVGRASEAGGACGLPIRPPSAVLLRRTGDTADRLSALLWLRLL